MSQLYQELSSAQYAFLDIGCGNGGSIDHCQRRFGMGRGLGLDISRSKVEHAVADGFSAICADIRAAELPLGCVRFASMMDVLEHLPTEKDAIEVLEKLRAVARDFMFIRHPSFEQREYLAELGLKATWTDWKRHPNMMKISGFRRAFALLDLTAFVIRPNMSATNSSAPWIVPLDAPVDTFAYDALMHGPKPLVQFDRPVWGKYDIFVRTNGDLSPNEWQSITDICGWESKWVASE
jgi:SAM-dependent methyltransferase